MATDGTTKAENYRLPTKITRRNIHLRIMVDGFALGIKNGTGLTRHAIETLIAIDEIGFSRDLVLGAPAALGTNDKILPAVVCQHLLTGQQKGLLESNLTDFIDIALALAQHSIATIGGRAHKMRRLQIFPQHLFLDGPVELSHFDNIYNSRSFFLTAFAWGSLTGRNLRVTIPSDHPTADIFHCTSPIPIKVSGVPKVTTIHDLIPLTMPQSTKVPLRSYYQILKASLRECAAVCCVSQETAREVSAFFSIPEDRLFVTYQSVDLSTHRELLNENFVRSTLREYELEPEGYLLFNGAVEPKKNLDRLITAYFQSDVSLPLVVLGPQGWLSTATEQRMTKLKNGKKQSIIRIPYADRLSQLAIMRGAGCLCFPSLTEGFGLPVLEAMSLGVPVITSTRPALQEIAGDAALAVDPKSITELSNAITQLMTDDSARKDFSTRGLKQASLFTKQRYAERLKTAYTYARGGT